MKKVMNFWLMAAVVCGLSFVVTSCKDDDNNSSNSNNNATAEELAADNANTFWSVAANLVSPFDVTANYQNKTFEPTIGEAEDGNNTVRVVVVPDASAAAAHFSAIVDADVKEATTTYTYNHNAVGTLTYAKSTDGKSLAKVDVSIKQIPHLQQIVYKTQEQLGTNASTGVPYYSFGDVISRTRSDGVKEYWMCIQAPFTKQGKTEAIWATVSPLPAENIWSYTASNGYTYQVPTGLGNNKEYMKDLTEMLFAMTSPSRWEKNMEDGAPDMKAFNMVKKGNVKYINQWFWFRVLKAWQEKKLSDTIFGTEINNFSYMLNEAGEGLKLLYHGYSWWKKSSNNLSLYEATIKSGNGIEANARHLTYREVKKDVIHPMTEVNCTSQLKGSQWVNESYFGDAKPRYVFRFATSRELSGNGMSIYETMNGINDIKDEYVYTKYYAVSVGSKQNMDNTIVKQTDITGDAHISPDEVNVGYYLCADGKFCETLEDANLNHSGPVAIVAYLGGNKRVESGKNFNGLAINMWTRSETKFEWGSNLESGNCPDLKVYANYADAKKDFSGIAATESLAAGCGNLNHLHSAAKYCNNLELTVNKRSGSISNWFLPSIGQWNLAILGLGGTVEDDALAITEAKLTTMHLPVLYPAENMFWSSTIKNAEQAYYFSNYKPFDESFNSNRIELQVVPFIAFKYGNGGTEEPN